MKELKEVDFKQLFEEVKEKTGSYYERAKGIIKHLGENNITTKTGAVNLIIMNSTDEGDFFNLLVCTEKMRRMSNTVRGAMLLGLSGPGDPVKTSMETPVMELLQDDKVEEYASILNEAMKDSPDDITLGQALEYIQKGEGVTWPILGYAFFGQS